MRPGTAAAIGVLIGLLLGAAAVMVATGFVSPQSVTTGVMSGWGPVNPVTTPSASIDSSRSVTQEALEDRAPVNPGVFVNQSRFPSTGPPVVNTARTREFLSSVSGLALLILLLFMARSGRARRDEHPLASLITRLFFMAILPALGVMLYANLNGASTDEILAAGVFTAGGIFGVLVIGCMLLARAGHPLRRGQEAQPPAETTQLSQELYRQAQTMEERLESLETILLEQRHRVSGFEPAGRRSD